MFDTRTTGKKIAALRKKKNMTQMELADEMGVSYQAVSNWERGNSMPDISKLPQLALLLGCSVDEILGESRETELVEQIIQGKEKEYIEETDTGADVIVNVAPVVRPEQTKEMVQVVISKNNSEKSEEGRTEGAEKTKSKISMEDLVGLAPYLEEEYLDELVEQIDVETDVKALIALAPFLADSTLDKAAKRVKLEKGLQEIVGLAPFLSEEALDILVEEVLEQEEIKECTGLFPFLSEKSLHKLANHMMRNGGGSALKKIMPFL